MKKATVATLKSFIRKNEKSIFINVRSKFDGMTDSVEDRNAGWLPLTKCDNMGARECTLGFRGVWLVGCSRDRVRQYSENGFNGFEVYNSCGKWIVATRVAA